MKRDLLAVGLVLALAAAAASPALAVLCGAAPDSIRPACCAPGPRCASGERAMTRCCAAAPASQPAASYAAALTTSALQKHAALPPAEEIAAVLAAPARLAAAARAHDASPVPPSPAELPLRL